MNGTIPEKDPRGELLVGMLRRLYIAEFTEEFPPASRRFYSIDRIVQSLTSASREIVKKEDVSRLLSPYVAEGDLEKVEIENKVIRGALQIVEAYRIKR